MLKHIKSSENWSEKNVAEKGFTLIELLVVIAILGILAVVGVLAFGGLTGSAHDATAKTEFGQVDTAISAYLAKDPANTIATLNAGSGAVANLKTAGLLKNHTLICTYTVTATDVTQDAGANGCTAANTDTL